MEKEAAELLVRTAALEAVFTTSPMQVRFSNGSKIISKGMDKPAKLKSLNGVSIVWIEECSEVKYAGFKEILGRLRHPTLSNHIILSTNPVSKSNWVFKHFFHDKATGLKVIDEEELYQKRIMVVGNTYYHHSTVDDNYFVPKDYVEQLDELQKHDPDLYRVARKGRFGVNGKIVFPQFTTMPYEKGMEAIRKIRNPLRKNGMDFGFVESYYALLRLVIDQDEKILYIIWEYYSRDKDDTEIEEDIKEFKQSQELIKADCAEPKTIRYFAKQGIRMRSCQKFKGSRSAYTKKVKRFKQIVCLDNCTNAIAELQELTFAVDKDGNIIEDEFNIDPHTLSAIWYFEDATVQAAIELTKELMTKYNIPADHVIRHYDVTGKICPNPYVYNYTQHTWEDFKAALLGIEVKKLSGWVQVTDGWLYYNGDTSLPVRNDWVKDQGKWYWFDGAGLMVINTWYQYNNAWYYLGPDGAMCQSQLVENSGKIYAVDADGKMITKPVTIMPDQDGALQYPGLKG